MKTWEMIKALTENNKLKFRSQDGYIAYVSSTGLFTLTDPDNREETSGSGYMRLTDFACVGVDEWELI